MYSNFENRKAFTIIELLVVIAVIGILVLLAAPKFLGYTEKAQVANIQSDIAAYEKAIDSKRIDNDKYIEDWEKVTPVTMNSLKKSLFNKKGLISDSNETELSDITYYKIQKDNKLVKTNLKGDFYLDQGGEVYYYDEKLASKVSGNKNETTPPVTDLPGPFTVTFKDYYGNVIETKTVEKGQAVTPPVNPVTGLEIEKWNKDLTSVVSDLEAKPVVDGPTDRDLLYNDSDFIWVANPSGQIGLNKEKGYFKYTGTGRATVEIPYVIQGVPMTSYFYMFHQSQNTEITKVISTNKNIIDMQSMFYNSNMTTLDLRQFDTSKVTDMNSMFRFSQATTLNVSKFDTSNVTNMKAMFASSKAKEIDVSNFNTSNVTNMNAMFWGSQITILDLSSFNISNVTNISGMFYDSQATTGYARTQTEADKFNISSGKPSVLTFIKKQ